MIIPIFIVGLLNLAGGVWVFQDSLASILYYIGKDGQRWHFDQLLRVLRGILGLVFIGMGIMILGGVAGR